MPTTANSWKRIPFTAGQPIEYATVFSPSEFARLQEGLLPTCMEDKWFVFYEEPHLFFHRSWTGSPVYRISFSAHAETWVVTEVLWADEFAKKGESDPAYQAQLLDFLVSNLLLGQAKPFPMPDGFVEPHPGVLQHNVSGTGYPQKPAAPKKP